MANAKGAAIPPLTILLLGTRRSSLKDLRGVIQVLHLKAQLLQLVHLFLLCLLLPWGSPCRNGRVWHPHRTVKQDPLISLFSSVFYFPVRVSLLIGDGQGYTNIIICIPRRRAHNS